MPILASVLNQLDHAIYTPAIQPPYAKGVASDKSIRKLPNDATVADLNFFRPGSKFFNLDAGLYSAGSTSNHNNPTPCMVTSRTRGKNQSTLVIGDSGGFQIATGVISPNKRERRNIFDWLVKYTDVAMTLDVPTFKMYEGKCHRFKKLKDCLFETLKYLAEFDDWGAKNHYFLNVLQGEGISDADTWYDEVKHHDFYGWAIAGPQKTQMKHILWRILALIEDGKFDRDETWLHFLGVGDLKTAVLLTTLRDVLRAKFEKCQIEISYDTSTPFKIAGKASLAYSLPTFGNGNLSLPTYQIDRQAWAGSKEKFPYTGSELAKYMTKEDIVRSNGKPDALSYLLLQNHNVEVQVTAIDAVHKILAAGLPRSYVEQLVPRYLLEAQSAIEQVLNQPTIQQCRDKLMERKMLKVLDSAYKDYPRPRTTVANVAAPPVSPKQLNNNVINLGGFR